MVKYTYDFLEFPEGNPKPRTTGLTLTRDPSMGLSELQIYLESRAEFLDYTKFRSMVPRLYPEQLTRDKIALYHEFDVGVTNGGMVFQFAWLQHKEEEFFDYVADIGFDAVEINFGLTDIPRDDILNAIGRLNKLGLKSVFEWGRKYPTFDLDLDEDWGELSDVLEVGADFIVFEQGELEWALEHGADKNPDDPLIELVNRVGKEKIWFEVNQDPHIAWVLSTFGADANIGPNLAHDQVPWVEPMRRGLGRATMNIALDQWTDHSDTTDARRTRKVK